MPERFIYQDKNGEVSYFSAKKIPDDQPDPVAWLLHGDYRLPAGIASCAGPGSQFVPSGLLKPM